MSKIVAVLAVTMFTFAATASAGAPQDFTSPDARPAAVTQDYRSPDARPTTVTQDPGSVRPALGRPGYVQDLRSPDARVVGPVAPRVATGTPHAPSSSSNSFEWGYLALGIAMVLIGVAGFALMQRRRRHGLAIGG